MRLRAHRPQPCLAGAPGSALPSPAAALTWRGCPPRTTRFGKQLSRQSLNPGAFPAPRKSSIHGGRWSGGSASPAAAAPLEQNLFAWLYPAEPWERFSQRKEAAALEGDLKLPRSE